MFGFNYIKFDSTNHVIQYKKGKVKKEGRGLAFWYFSPTTSIVSIPLQSSDFQFVFKESTQDYQEVTLQGQVTYKVTSPQQLADNLDFTVNSRGQYVKDDFEKLEQRIINEVQTAASSIVQTMVLKEALRSVREVEAHIFEQMEGSKTFEMLDLGIMRVNLLGIVPSPEMARALEAETREGLQKDADKAIYERRNFAVEQERMIQESELNTEIAVEEKQRQIAEKKMETELVKQENDHRLLEMGMESEISLERQKQDLIDLKVENEKKEADVKEYVLNASLKPYQGLDWKTLMAINSRNVDPKSQIALAFRELAENAGKIGNLNISPDLLDSILSTKRK